MKKGLTERRALMGPFRIRKPSRQRAENQVQASGTEFSYYLDRLIKMIPGEVVSLYLVGKGIIPGPGLAAQLIWAIICLAGLIVLRAYGSHDPNQGEPIQWASVLLSAIAFVIWVYTLGGPFAVFSWYKPYIGSLLVLCWTFFVPIFYQGD